ncbi:MAG: hypothetical protein NC203_03465 [Firmicutes bacterium]|nr:hypothetical protein [[Eubacterium] siraeum]MCM1487404.1 hypothetical protein [Bacillota bacterium]
MSKKNKKHSEKATAENYYNLKTEAIDKLVNAKNAPPVSDEEIEKYTRRHKLRIPTWFKIVFIKFWFSGAVCYFFLWGLGLYISGLDLMAVLAIGLGVTMDLMVNHALRHFEPQKGAFDKWMMIPCNKFWTIFLNVIYAAVLLFFVVQTYNVINIIFTGSTADNAETVAVGVEPFLFGLLFMGYDMLFITIKNTVIKVFKDAEKKVSSGK